MRPPSVQKLELKHLERVLKIHNCLPGKEVVLRSCNATKKKGWISGRTPTDLIGKKGIVVNVHGEVVEAVKVYFNEREERFWCFEDLEIVEMKDPEPIIFHYDPVFLDI